MYRLYHGIMYTGYIIYTLYTMQLTQDDECKLYSLYNGRYGAFCCIIYINYYVCDSDATGRGLNESLNRAGSLQMQSDAANRPRTPLVSSPDGRHCGGDLLGELRHEIG